MTMSEKRTADAPAWLDRNEYPFAPHFFETGHGRLHYIVEGPEDGPPIVFVHGTPTWSFEWRHLIKGITKPSSLGGEKEWEKAGHRCYALDHLGFGLSDKPTDWTFRPEDHAANFAAWINHLGLKDITLVVHDFGGPIALAYALQHPENVRGIVLCNTWLWSLAKEPRFTGPERLFAGTLGRFLYERLAFSPRVILPSAYGDKRRLTRAVHAHYLNALPDANARKGTYGMLKGLVGSSAWYESLWAKREHLNEKPMLILWGGADFAFQKSELKRWQEAFPNAETHWLSGVGHWPQEEAPQQVIPFLTAFLERIEKTV
jgi:pimeloyl-ACP methyl ester carboxylesterase